jgi:hypothetical protein
MRFGCVNKLKSLEDLERDSYSSGIFERTWCGSIRGIGFFGGSNSSGANLILLSVFF